MKKQIAIAALVAAGLGLGVALQQPSQEASVTKDEPKIAYWVAPMDPNYRADKPGKSPMGMDLVPFYENAGGADDINAVRLSPSVINNLGVRTAKVELGTFRSRIETVGYIDYDESKVTHVHLRAEGWVEKIFVNSIGERVKKGDPLFDVYSPELVNAQSDYLDALKTGRRGIVQASKERLRALDIPEELIKQLGKTRKVSQFVRIRAPQDGIISDLNVFDGVYVTPKTTTVSLADLSSVWLLVDVFESQSSIVKEGLPAVVRLSYEPGRVWKGRIAYVYPQIEPATRTLKVRLVFDNPGEILKPDMYANISIFGEQKTDTLMIQREALIRTGKSDRVIIALGEGRFQPAKVVVGLESGDKIEILDGIEEGEDVVTSAQFLIDSEASFSGSALRMSSLKTKKHKMDEMAKDTQDEQVTEAPEIWGVGTINKIMTEHRKVNMTHGPIEALGWPAMTMGFGVSEGVDLGVLTEKMEIHFKIEKREDGAYEIVEIMTMQEMGK